MAKRSLALRFERTTAIILSGGLVLVAVLYFFVMSPVTSRHASTETQLAQLDQQITSLEQRTSQIAAGSSTLKNMYQHDLVLDGLLPNTLNQAQEFIALSQGMTASGLVIDSFASVPAGTSSLSVAGATSLTIGVTQFHLRQTAHDREPSIAKKVAVA